MRLHEPLADGEAEPRAANAGLALAPRRAGILLEEMRHALGRDASAFVGDRDRDMHPVTLRRDPDRRGFPCVTRGVGKQVVQHLLDALAVGHSCA